MKTIPLLSSLIAIVVITVIAGGVQPPPPKAGAEMSHVEPAQSAQKPKQANIAPEAKKPAQPAQTKPSVENKPDTTPNCGAHTAKEVFDILISIGVPRLAAIEQTGSWKHESGGDFNQCQTRGDGGIAHGLNSWHPGRRQDMPLNLAEQIKWAVHTEMPRDCRKCYDQFMAAESVGSVRSAIQRSTRWGIEGLRWLYADQLNNQL